MTPGAPITPKGETAVEYIVVTPITFFSDSACERADMAPFQIPNIVVEVILKFIPDMSDTVNTSLVAVDGELLTMTDAVNLFPKDSVFAKLIPPLKTAHPTLVDAFVAVVVLFTVRRPEEFIVTGVVDPNVADVIIEGPIFNELP